MVGWVAEDWHRAVAACKWRSKDEARTADATGGRATTVQQILAVKPRYLSSEDFKTMADADEGDPDADEAEKSSYFQDARKLQKMQRSLEQMLRTSNAEDRKEAGISESDFVHKIISSNGRMSIQEYVSELDPSAILKSTKALEKVMRKATSGKAVRSGIANSRKVQRPLLSKGQVLDYAEEGSDIGANPG